jgi:hypothetical protein
VDRKPTTDRIDERRSLPPVGNSEEADAANRLRHCLAKPDFRGTEVLWCCLPATRTIALPRLEARDVAFFVEADPAQHRVELASVDGLLESDACWLTIRNFLVQLSVRAERPRVIVAQSPMKPALAAPDDQAMGADLLGIAQCTPEPGRDLPRVSAEVPHHAQHIVMHLIPRRDSG